MTSPMSDALAALREAVAEAERVLAERTSAGAPLDEQLAAASSVTVARRALVETASGRRDSGDLARFAAAAGDDGAQALAGALAGLPEPEPETDPNPGDDDPLAALFR